jgi:hypothetical protein
VRLGYLNLNRSCPETTKMIAATISRTNPRPRRQAGLIPSRNDVQRDMAEIRSRWSPQTCAVRAALAAHRSQMLFNSIFADVNHRKCG